MIIRERRLKKKKKYFKGETKHLKETELKREKNMLNTFDLDNTIKIITLQNENKQLQYEILEYKKKMINLKKNANVILR